MTRLIDMHTEDLRQVIRSIIDEYIDEIKKPEVPAPPQPGLMTIKQVALLFKVSKVTIYKWIDLKIIPSTIKIGGRCYFRTSQIMGMIEKAEGLDGKRWK